MARVKMQKLTTKRSAITRFKIKCRMAALTASRRRRSMIKIVAFPTNPTTNMTAKTATLTRQLTRSKPSSRIDSSYVWLTNSVIFWKKRKKLPGQDKFGTKLMVHALWHGGRTFPVWKAEKIRSTEICAGAKKWSWSGRPALDSTSIAFAWLNKLISRDTFSTAGRMERSAQCGRENPAGPGIRGNFRAHESLPSRVLTSAKERVYDGREDPTRICGCRSDFAGHMKSPHSDTVPALYRTRTSMTVITLSFRGVQTRGGRGINLLRGKEMKRNPSCSGIRVWCVEKNASDEMENVFHLFSGFFWVVFPVLCKGNLLYSLVIKSSKPSLFKYLRRVSWCDRRAQWCVLRYWSLDGVAPAQRATKPYKKCVQLFRAQVWLYYISFFICQ